MKNKQSKLMNQGQEELSIDQIYEMSGLIPTNIIVNHNAKMYLPRKMYNYFIPQINHYSRKKDSLLTCLVVESNNKKYFHSPSMTLMATLQRKNADEIREMLGQNDDLDSVEKSKIHLIIKYIRAGNSLSDLRKITNKKTGIITKYGHIETKRLDNILEKKILEDVLYNGKAFRGLIPSKKTYDFYEVSQKQWLKFKDNIITVPQSLQISCDCGFGQASFLKYEYEIIASACSHVEFLRQTLTNPTLGKNVRLKNKYGSAQMQNISNLFNPFNLDYPENETKELRTIIRNGLFNFIVSQKFIEENFDDSKNYHKKNGFTWFRCELDAFLLSFKEVYNKEVYDLWTNNVNENESFEYTCKFFGDYRPTGNFIPVNAVHEFDEDTKILNHNLNDKWMNVKHLGKDLQSNLEGLIQNDQFIHDENNNYNHNITDSSVPRNLQITHVIEEMEPFLEHNTPFKVGKLNNGVKIYIKPYQMRDSK
jgi:hypothetical protein